jgi:hypothetical protein
MVGHVGVVLDRVKVDPWESELSRLVVTVVRLMHMPHQDEIYGLHLGYDFFGNSVERSFLELIKKIPE